MNPELSVNLGERSYPIHIGSGLLASGTSLSGFAAGSDCLVVSNTTVAPLYGEALDACLPGLSVTHLELPDGEQHKTMQTLGQVHDALASMRAPRDVTVIALGGGVIGDIAGFAAASWMRGVAFVQVPTTLLAQVDSSVGGKTGVNHDSGKNLIGAFHQPKAVIIDTDTLDTLPDRQLRAGLAEVIKHGAIADAEFFGWLEACMPQLLERDAKALAYAIRRSLELKAEIVAEDEREAGRRAILNYGHTFGHAIERLQGYGDWLHGEAVAAGMVMAAELSQIAEVDVARIRALIEAAGLPTQPPALGAELMREAMGMDKKVLGRKLRFIVLEKLGQAIVTSDVDDARLDRVLRTAA